MSEWISVKDLLPPAGVLVEAKSERVLGKCKLQSGGGWYLQISPMFGGLLHPNSYPTYWRPPPEPPTTNSDISI